MYQGQALGGQPTQAPAAGGGLHFLEGAGNLLLAGLHLFSGSGDSNEEGQDEEPARRKRNRFSSSFSRPSKPAGACCRAKRPTK